MDLERDLFRVTLSAKSPATRDGLFQAVSALGYRPSEAGAGNFRSTPEPLHPVGAAPEIVTEACARAKAEGKNFVIVDCGGDG